MEARQAIARQSVMALRMRSPLPSFDGVETWINGDAPRNDELRGRPVVVSFWSLSCYQCHDTAEQVAALRDTYTQQGVLFLAVHQPRSQDELDVTKATTDARDEMHLTQPCAIDNEHILVDRFSNEFVPAFYVFNRNHEMRYFQAGAKGLERLETAIGRVVEESIEASAV